MRVLLALVTVLACCAASAAGFWLWGAGMVGPQASIELSCRLLAVAERDGVLSRSQHFEIILKVAGLPKLSPAEREAANRLRIACPKH